MKNFKRNLLEEFIEMDERISNLYEQIKKHPAHHRKLDIEESINKKGSIKYGKYMVSIQMDINLGEESVLILAHELMHYLLVLNGALLPIQKMDKLPSRAESLEDILMKSITHHFLLKQELDLQGFKELQSKYALSDIVVDVSSGYYHDDEFWLIEQYDKATFAKKFDFVSLKERFEEENMLSVFELLQNSPKRTIDDINELSQRLIEAFKFEEYIHLVDIDGYTGRK